MNWRQDLYDLIPEITKYLSPIDNQFAKYINKDFYNFSLYSKTKLNDWEKAHKLIVQSGGSWIPLKSDNYYRWNSYLGILINFEYFDKYAILTIIDFWNFSFVKRLDHSEFTPTTNEKYHYSYNNLLVFHFLNGTTCNSSLVIDFGCFEELTIKFLQTELPTHDYFINLSNCDHCANINYGVKCNENLLNFFTTSKQIMALTTIYYGTLDYFVIIKISLTLPPILHIHSSDGKQVSLPKDVFLSLCLFFPFLQNGSKLLNLKTFETFSSDLLNFGEKYYNAKTKQIIWVYFNFIQGMIVQIWILNDKNEYVLNKSKNFAHIDSSVFVSFCEESNHLFIRDKNINRFINLNKF